MRSGPGNGRKLTVEEREELRQREATIRTARPLSACSVSAAASRSSCRKPNHAAARAAAESEQA